jgi:hypothetical protein
VQSVIASYLFQQKSIALPGLGSLHIEQKPAGADFPNKAMLAPQPAIRFSLNKDASAAESFVTYLSQQKAIGLAEAASTFSQWCSDAARSLQANGQFYMAHIGTFFQQGQTVSFTPANLPEVFLPPVPAERVVRPEAAHTMLVGDKETTTAAMTEYFTGTPVAKQRWWIAALAIAVLALALAGVRFGQAGFGRQQMCPATTLQPAEAPVLHQALP